MKVDFSRVGAKGRAPELDAFRGCFVLLMFAAHVARFAARGSDNPVGRLWDFVLWFEPAISAGFLFVVGVSLHASLTRARATEAAFWRPWYSRLLARALSLYLVAILLFVSQYGFELPDALLAPDILSAIALALLGTGLALRAGGLGLMSLVVIVLTVVALLESSGEACSGLNAGPGGALPLIAFSALGASIARWSTHFGKLLWVAVGIALLALALPGGWVVQVESNYSTGTLTFWNHSLKGALLLAPFLLGTAWLFLGLPRLHATTRLGWVRLLGRHALLAYLTHLVILEASRRAGLFPVSASIAVGYLAALILAVCGLLSLTNVARLNVWLNRAGERIGVRF